MMENYFNKIYTVKTIADVNLLIQSFLNQVKEKKYDIDDLLIVFDIDDTLISVNLSDDYNIFIANQYYKKNNFQPTSLQNELGNIEYAILANKIYCEHDTLKILNQITESGINQILVTSRNLHLMQATIHNLEMIKMLDVICKNKFYKKNHHTILLDCNTLYNKNILFVSDKSKGTALKRMLDHLDLSFKIIIVVDNTWNKISSFFEPFRGSQIIGLWYTAVNAEL